MPSRQKTLLFFAGFVSSAGSFAIICTSLGTQAWVSSEVRFTGGNYSGIADVKLGLFQVTRKKTITEGVALNTPTSGGQVLQILKETSSVKVTHVIIILCLVVSLLSALLGSGITCFNSVSNPYLTFLGPLGVYVWSAINGVFVLLAMILCAINMEANKMQKELAIAMDTSFDVFGTSRNTYGYSYWILLLSIFLNAATIAVIYYYQHARYSEQKQQERPMETASRDVILF